MSLLRAIVALPFVLLVPGYAIAAALFSPGEIPRSDRAVYTFVFGIAAAALGGLIVQVFLGLSSWVWLGLLVGVTVAAGVVARRRRAADPDPPARRPLPRPPAGAAWAVALAVAVAASGVAVAIAVQGLREQRSRQVFASFWASPVPPGEESSAPHSPLRVGVWNHGGPSAYSIEVTEAGSPVETVPIHLEDERWEGTLPGVDSRAGAVVITLLREGRPYRRLRLNIGERR